MSNSSTAPDEILKFAENYQHNPNLHVVLDPYRAGVLLLRAKYATYDTITETLNARGVVVSQATVRNFCRRHQAEMKQLRNDLDRKHRETKGAPSVVVSGSSSASGKGSTTTDSGKPGPKIARDEL